MNVEIDLQPCQIVCLENGSDRLYAEVIQVVRSRQVAWVRPLVLVKACPTSTDEAFQVACDLRQGSDLLWPIGGFRLALDVEVIPLFAEMNASPVENAASSPASKQLRTFIEQLWQARHQTSS
ncbi:hypothetical protein QQ056_06505 [Oscillatoria laete-virens NRMC-F 0139]|nr:hypothetical protein [Oscillatoria laete-virens]MDI9634287.1 hypothetical protein [Geitlerinema splendidum]MDL5053194.1 hypothetical protein [Oscillatoria laete-virens NRMC-F 0139]